MQGKNYVEMIVLDNLNLVDLVVKRGSVLSVNVDGGTVYIKSDYFEMRTNIRVLENENDKPFNELFALKEEVDSALNFGSEIKLLTNKGVATYSIEGIHFKNGGIAYAALDLKIV